MFHSLNNKYSIDTERNYIHYFVIYLSMLKAASSQTIMSLIYTFLKIGACLKVLFNASIPQE